MTPFLSNRLNHLMVKCSSRLDSVLSAPLSERVFTPDFRLYHSVLIYTLLGGSSHEHLNYAARHCIAAD